LDNRSLIKLTSRKMEKTTSRRRKAADPTLEQCAIDISAAVQSIPPSMTLAATKLALAIMRISLKDLEAEPLPDRFSAQNFTDSDRAYFRVMARSKDFDKDVLEAEGGSLSRKDFAAMLPVSEDTIRNYLNRGKILAWKKGGRNYRYPAWQIFNGQLLPGLHEVIPILNEKSGSPIGHICFFLNSNDLLKYKRPLDVLRKGDVKSVVRAAHLHLEMGT
jgi:hypothetical protein